MSANLVECREKCWTIREMKRLDVKDKKYDEWFLSIGQLDSQSVVILLHKQSEWSYSSRKLIPHIIYNFFTKWEEFPTRKTRFGLNLPKSVMTGFYDYHHSRIRLVFPEVCKFDQFFFFSNAFYFLVPPSTFSIISCQ